MRKALFVTVILGCCNAAIAQTLQLLKEISLGFGSSNPSGFTVAGDKLFFIAKDDANQWRLYVTQGTEASTQLLGPSSVINGTLNNPAAYNGKLFFSCDDGVNGQELWTSDGTVAGTVLFKDLYPGVAGSYPLAFTVANGKLFFMANTADGEKRLFASDGTPAGTILIRNDYSLLFNGMSNYAVLNNDIYFTGDDGSGAGYGLWKSNGTVAGTVLVKGPFSPGVFGCNYAVLNNKLYFSGFDYTNGGELWVTDGTDAGTHIVINLRTDQPGILYGGAPQGLTVYQSKIYFCAGDDTHGDELFVTDGTAAGTQLVKDIYPGPTGSLPTAITILNGMMYIACQFQKELWKSDGTAAGTQLVAALPEYPRFAAVFCDKLYIISGTGQYLYESNGTTAGTGYAKADNTSSLIAITGPDQFMTTYNSALYFGGSCIGISPSTEPLKFVAATIVHNFSFTGNGNWSNPANWAGGAVPPANMMAGDNVLINGNCILDISVHARAGATITVAAGKTLVIQGSLTIN